MPYPAKEKKFISCLSCKQDDVSFKYIITMSREYNKN